MALTTGIRKMKWIKKNEMERFLKTKNEMNEPDEPVPLAPFYPVATARELNR